MKKFFLFTALVAFSGSIYSLSAQTITPVPVIEAPGPAGTPAVDAPSMPLTEIVFEEITHDFGTINQGEKVSHTYRFVNKGANPAKIENVKPGCSCTAPDFTREEVAPGGEGFVKLEFNSAYKQGDVAKSATVTYNGEPKVITLSLRANIVVPAPPANGTSPATPAPGAGGTSTPAPLVPNH